MQIKSVSTVHSFKNSHIFSKFQSYPYIKNDYQQTLLRETGKPITKKSRYRLLLGILAATTLIGGAIFCYIKRKKLPSDIKIADNIQDSVFKNSIILSLKSEGINCDIKALNSIAGPDEFSNLIKKFARDNFDIGKQAQGLDNFHSAEEFENFLYSSGENLQNYYQNFANGRFRVTLHTHSHFSDGRATVSEFLENARKYADHIAQKGQNDNLPPFTIALTDHDNVEGCKEAIRIIVQNPEKYKNLKFVAGAELSVAANINSIEKSHFDVTALAINPFDSSVNEMLKNLRQARINTINKLLKSYPLQNGGVLTLDDLIKWQKKNGDGKIDIETMAGVSAVRHAIDAFNKISGKEIDKSYSHLDIPDMADVIKVIHGSDGKISLTHPLKSFWRKFDEETLDFFRNKGVDGFEAYHQYSPANFFKLKDKNGGTSIERTANWILNSFKNYAEKHNMFLSGGTDSHNKHPFIYHPHGKQIEEFINNIIN